jgi:HSP20 family protein
MTMAEKNTETKVDVKPEAPTALEKREERRPRRWDPFEMFDELQEEMARFWGQAFPLVPRPWSRPLRRMALAPSEWTPSVDVYERDNTLVVKAEVPGLKKEDIEVALDQGDLVIRGERKAESEVKEENYYRIERNYGSFYRRIPLPFEVQADQVSASYNDGVLEVRIPKPAQEQAQPQRIPLR